MNANTSTKNSARLTVTESVNPVIRRIPPFPPGAAATEAGKDSEWGGGEHHAPLFAVMVSPANRFCPPPPTEY